MSYGQTEDKATEAQRVSEMADMILEKNHFVCVFETEELLFPRNGVYHPYGENLVKEYCELWCPTLHYPCTNHFVAEVVEKIRRKCYIKAVHFDRDPYIINLHNGVLDIKNLAREDKVKFLGFDEIPDPMVGEIMDSEKHPRAENRFLSRIQLPVEYNPEAKCPKILKFLTEVLPEARDRRVLLEFAAITLFRSPMFHRAMMLVGEGRNGKSTFVFLLQSLLGKENVSNVSIHDIVSNRFMKAELSSKLGNFFPDINSKEITQLGVLQSIIAGDRLKVERKGRDPFDADWFVKLIFSCNKLPQITDPTIAWWERWSIITFGQSFIGRENRNLATPEGTGELQTTEEMSGFLNLLLEILREVLKRGRLTDSKTNDQKREEWGEMANHLLKFVKGKLVVDQGGCIRASEFFPSYVEWCGTKYIALGRKEFIDQVTKLVPIREDTKRFGGRKSPSEKIWRGVRFRDDTSQTLDSGGLGPSQGGQPAQEDAEVAPGVWVGRDASDRYPRLRGFYPNHFLIDLATKAKAEGWGEFAKLESKGEAAKPKAQKKGANMTALEGMKAFEEAGTAGDGASGPSKPTELPKGAIQETPVSSQTPRPEPPAETEEQRFTREAMQAVRENPELAGDAQTLEIARSMAPPEEKTTEVKPVAVPTQAAVLPKDTCPKCKTGKIEGPLHYRIIMEGENGRKEKVEVCRDCWFKDQMGGRKKQTE